VTLHIDQWSLADYFLASGIHIQTGSWFGGTTSNRANGIVKNFWKSKEIASRLFNNVINVTIRNYEPLILMARKAVQESHVCAASDGR
jgi:hypothetical protein